MKGGYIKAIKKKWQGRLTGTPRPPELKDLCKVPPTIKVDFMRLKMLLTVIPYAGYWIFGNLVERNRHCLKGGTIYGRVCLLYIIRHPEIHRNFFWNLKI